MLFVSRWLLQYYNFLDNSYEYFHCFRYVNDVKKGTKEDSRNVAC